MMYENEAVSSKKRDLLDRKHVEHIKSQQRSLLLLKLAMLITFLLYLMFNLHLYLGDFTTWGSYFHEMAAIAGFSFALVIAILMAGFLSWVKHHAYLHFGLHGSVPLVLVTVIGFALFAELFSSSASQDAKTHLMLNNNSAYQQTLQAPGSVNAPSPIVMGSGLAVDIAAAQQRLARCEENLKRGREKHCNGDKAKLDALESSQQAQLQAQTQATIAASKAQAQANLEAQKLNFERQDQLKADSYNSSIVTIAKFISGIFGNDYTDNIKTATVICMLFVAICFEILHHFLSASKEKADMAVDGIELEIAKLDGNKTEFKPMEEKSVNTEARNNNPGFGFSAPATAQSKGYFKYQNETEEPKSTKNPIGFIDYSQQKVKRNPTAANTKPHLGTHEEQLELKELGDLKATGGGFSGPTPATVSDHGDMRAHHAHSNMRAHSANVRGKVDAHSEDTHIDGKDAHSEGTHVPANMRAHSKDAHSKQYARTLDAHNDKALLEAMKDAQGKLDADTLKEGYSLYDQWRKECMVGEIKPTAAPGKAFINRQLCQAKKKTINPAGMTALLEIWGRKGVKDGWLKVNPKYTGKPPHPKYILA